MKSIVYTCDHCGHESKAVKEFIHLSVSEKEVLHINYGIGIGATGGKVTNKTGGVHFCSDQCLLDFLHDE